MVGNIYIDIYVYNQTISIYIIFLVEAEIENIVFSNQKYHGDSLNFFTQRKIASLAQEKKKKKVVHLSFISILEGRAIELFLETVF